jgi:ankyrin repeat protein
MKTRRCVVLFAVLSCVPHLRAQSADLFTAARTDDVKLAQTLIDKKVNINQRDDKGYTALILATYNQSPGVAELLLKSGASTEIKDSMDRTALMGGLVPRRRQWQLLLQHRAKVNETDANGATSLMYAVQFGRKSVIKLLIAAKADITIKDKRGFDASILPSR